MDKELFLEWIERVRQDIKKDKRARKYVTLGKACNALLDTIEENINNKKYDKNMKELFETRYKKYRLEVKMSNGIPNDNLLVIEDNNFIKISEIIEQQFEDKKEFITFGQLGVRRELVEWYRITEIVE